MGLEDLKDQLKESTADLWSRIEASPAYSNLREKFETQTPGAQKGIIAGVVALIALTLLSFPLSDFSDSSTHVDDYNLNRGLLRNLLRASRLASEAGSVPAAFSAAELKSQAESQLNSFALKPEQLGGVIDLNLATLGAPLAPSRIIQTGIGVSLKKLNLKQIVDIGFELQKINPSVKIAGMEIAASSPDPHYFDVLYKLILFSMPTTDEEPPSDKRKKGN